MLAHSRLLLDLISCVGIGNTSKQNWVLGALLAGHCTKKVQTALTFSLQDISSRDGSSYSSRAKRQLTVTLLVGPQLYFCVYLW